MERKELHKKENKTKEEKIEYSELDKTVKKMKRERNKKKRKKIDNNNFGKKEKDQEK